MITEKTADRTVFDEFLQQCNYKPFNATKPLHVLQDVAFCFNEFAGMIWNTPWKSCAWASCSTFSRFDLGLWHAFLDLELGTGDTSRSSQIRLKIGTPSLTDMCHSDTNEHTDGESFRRWAWRCTIVRLSFVDNRKNTSKPGEDPWKELTDRSKYYKARPQLESRNLIQLETSPCCEDHYSGGGWYVLYDCRVFLEQRAQHLSLTTSPRDQSICHSSSDQVVSTSSTIYRHSLLSLVIAAHQA